MTESGEGLVQALTERDEARRLLASVEQLEIGGAITEEHRDAARRDYQNRVARAEKAVQDARHAVRTSIDEFTSKLENLSKQEATLDVRYKVGEYDEVRYKQAAADLAGQRRNLEMEASSLKTLLAAETSAAASAAVASKGKAPPKSEGARPSAVRQRSVPASAGSPTRSESKGGIAAWLAEGTRLRMVSLGLVVVGAVVIVALLARVGLSAAGGLGLPSLSSLIPGSDDGVSEIGSTGPSGLDEQTPSTSGGGALAPAAVDTAQVLLNVQGGTAVGSLHVELVYDATLLEVASLQWGQLPADALYEYAVQPGRVTVGLVAPSGLGTSPTLATVALQPIQASSGGQVPLYLENVTAHNGATLAEMAASVAAGSVDLSTMSVVAPTMVFGGQA